MLASRSRALHHLLTFYFALSPTGTNVYLQYAVQGRAERLRETARRFERKSGWNEG